MSGIVSARGRRALIFLAVCAVVLVAAPAAALASYDFQRGWGSFGVLGGQFDDPRAVAVDAAGFVYVADTNNNRLQKFTESGAFITEWGGFGTGKGKFVLPQGVAVDRAGNVYVADTFNNRIQKFSRSGKYLTSWGVSGTRNGQFQLPQGVAVDGAGNVYVADSFNDRVQKFNASGTYVAQWGSAGEDSGEFMQLSGVAADVSGNVYTVESGGERVQKFDSAGTHIAEWGGHGAGDGQFDKPVGIAADGAGNVYVADTGNVRVQRFDADGTFLTSFGSAGSGDGQFTAPNGLAVSHLGEVFVIDPRKPRVQVFSGPPALTVDPGSLVFGETIVGRTSAPLTLTVGNTGEGPLTITAATIEGAAPGQFAIPAGADLCAGTSIGPAEECTISVRFAPTAVGAPSAALAIASDTPGGPTAVSLIGTAAPPPPAELMVTPGSLTFSKTKVGKSSATKTVMVRNTGGVSANIGARVIVGIDAGQFRITEDRCPAVLAPATECRIRLRFKPSKTGTKVADLMIESDDPAGADRVALAGTGKKK